MIKNEFNNVNKSEIKIILKKENDDFFKSRRDKEEKKKDKSKQKQDDDEKEIDFKAKALKAKEHGLKSKIRGAMKGASGKVNNEKKQNEKFLKFFKNLKVVQNQKLFPCVVFSFSRK